MRRLLILATIVLATGATGFAQLEPESAHAILYFPQLADGGTPSAEQWQTVLTFLNPSSSDVLTVVSFYGNSGEPLLLDFGAGAAATLTLTLPPGGVRVFKSRMANDVITTGWAYAASTLPIQGVVTFRQFIAGKPIVEIADQGISPAAVYSSFANRNLGIAIANIDATASVTYRITLSDADGANVGTQTLTLPPLGHSNFNLWALFPLDSSFMGTVAISGASKQFAAWTLNASELGLLTSLPPGRFKVPLSQRDRLWDVFLRLVRATKSIDSAAFSSPVSFQIKDDAVINAYATGDGRSILVNTALAELLGDSDSELAFVIAHEFGHIYQTRTGRREFSLNPELDADALGLLFSLVAGYDPYASAGVFGRLQMTSGLPGLLGEVLREIGTDPHQSYSSRIDNVFSTISDVCATPELSEFCATYKSVFHPHFPASLPLNTPRSEPK